VSAHVDEAVWERLAMRELSTTERAATLEHVMACERCRTIWRGLTELEAGARDAGLYPTPVRRARWWIGAGAAAVAVAAALVLWWRLPGEPETLRGGPDRAVELIEPAPPLRWQPVDGATRYRVEVFTADGHAVWTRELATTSVPWPADQRPGTYRWRVTALGTAGELAHSRLAPLEIAP
jgi:hypothetical protein